MTDEITPELFEHLVELAAFAFDPQEAKYLRRELNKQLRAIHQLEAVPLEDSVPPASHGVPYTDQTTPPLRKDRWVPCDNPDEILEQAPQVEDRYIIVPDIPHTELD
ncbi:MAG: Asp-tRNA(Asn)/Glu-tRNA(Gln) amidotransferase subunit GatC [Chloroflexota bacterium]|nr:Asp-tRNA(Asn)/Glu-tRNA(Gln) amidotransferase subunit GatC [Chloroflexota bacterium]